MTEKSGIRGRLHGKRWRVAAWGTGVLLLLLPLIAMQFTGEVGWTAFDFAFFGAMLLVVGGAFELTVRKTASRKYRAAVAVALAAAFLLVWINGAVGIIGSENNPANLMFAGVLGIAFLGALVARFRPAGMARAMTAAAVGQAAVALAAIVLGLGPADPQWPWNLLALTGFFAGLWLLSARLFKASSRP